MRALVIAILALSGIAVLSISGTSAAPLNGAVVAGAAAATSPVINARVYCRRHYTYSSRWRFLHWGHC